MSNLAYATLCAIAFKVPTDTGALKLEAIRTAVDSNNQNRAYTENKRCYQDCQSLERACNNQLIKAIPKEYMDSKANKNRGFTGGRARDILKNIFTNYG